MCFPSGGGIGIRLGLFLKFCKIILLSANVFGPDLGQSRGGFRICFSLFNEGLPFVPIVLVAAFTLCGKFLRGFRICLRVLDQLVPALCRSLHIIGPDSGKLLGRFLICLGKRDKFGSCGLLLFFMNLPFCPDLRVKFRIFSRLRFFSSRKTSVRRPGPWP